MTDTAATSYDGTSFDGRVFPVDNCRRVVNAVVIGLGTLAAAGGLTASVTVAAAWIISAALSANPNTHASLPIGPGKPALAKFHVEPASAAVAAASAAVAAASAAVALASVADVSGPARVSTAPADAPDASFAARWAGATAYASASAMPPVPHRSVVLPRPPESASNAPSRLPRPSEVLQIALAPDLTHVAMLPAAAAPAFPLPASLLLPPELDPEWTGSIPLPRLAAAPHEIKARSPLGPAAAQVAMVTPPSISEIRIVPQQARSKSMLLPGPDSRTAVYDIAAHTVYLPNGDGLEAHSGLGSKLDDPRYVNLKNRGATPPNVYDLALREQSFHGVRAIRLNPVGDDSMFGRDGILAHSYMLGPNGQSNGCVSFRDYPTFLRAVLRGEVDRLVVVPNLGTRPSRTALASVASIGNVARSRQ